MTSPISSSTPSQPIQPMFSSPPVIANSSVSLSQEQIQYIIQQVQYHSSLETLFLPHLGATQFVEYLPIINHLNAFLTNHPKSQQAIKIRLLSILLRTCEEQRLIEISLFYFYLERDHQILEFDFEIPENQRDFFSESTFDDERGSQSATFESSNVLSGEKDPDCQVFQNRTEVQKVKCNSLFNHLKDEILNEVKRQQSVGNPSASHVQSYLLKQIGMLCFFSDGTLNFQGIRAAEALLNTSITSHLSDITLENIQSIFQYLKSDQVFLDQFTNPPEPIHESMEILVRLSCLLNKSDAVTPWLIQTTYFICLLQEVSYHQATDVHATANLVYALCNHPITLLLTYKKLMQQGYFIVENQVTIRIEGYSSFKNQVKIPIFKLWLHSWMQGSDARRNPIHEMLIAYLQFLVVNTTDPFTSHKSSLINSLCNAIQLDVAHKCTLKTALHTHLWFQVDTTHKQTSCLYITSNEIVAITRGNLSQIVQKILSTYIPHNTPQIEEKPLLQTIDSLPSIVCCSNHDVLEPHVFGFPLVKQSSYLFVLGLYSTMHTFSPQTEKHPFSLVFEFMSANKTILNSETRILYQTPSILISLHPRRFSLLWSTSSLYSILEEYCSNPLLAGTQLPLSKQQKEQLLAVCQTENLSNLLNTLPNETSIVECRKTVISNPNITLEEKEQFDFELYRLFMAIDPGSINFEQYQNALIPQEKKEIATQFTYILFNIQQIRKNLSPIHLASLLQKQLHALSIHKSLRELEVTICGLHFKPIPWTLGTMIFENDLGFIHAELVMKILFDNQVRFFCRQGAQETPLPPELFISEAFSLILPA